MQLKESALIKAPIEKVWDFIINPDNTKLWNPKLKKVTRWSIGKEALGYRYEVLYEMSGKSNALNAKIVTFDKPNHLKIECEEISKTNPDWVSRKIFEEYILTQKNEGVFVEQIITIENPGIPWVFRFLIWFVRTFGAPKNPYEKECLKQLKDLIEAKV